MGGATSDKGLSGLLLQLTFLSQLFFLFFGHATVSAGWVSWVSWLQVTTDLTDFHHRRHLLPKEMQRVRVLEYLNVAMSSSFLLFGC